MPKGDVLATAQVAGIMAAKKTWELIPLCHILNLSGVEINLTPNTEHPLLTLKQPSGSPEKQGQKWNL